MTGQTSRGASGDALRRRLEADLLSGAIPAGARLPSERRLATVHGVSRPVVREVLRGLVERDLIEVSPGRGAFARSVTPLEAAAPLERFYRRGEATALEVVQARVMLERETAGLAAQHAGRGDIEEIAGALAGLEADDGVIARARADIRFHGAIARAAGNVVVETMFASVAGLAFQLMLRSLSDRRVTEEANPLHAVVLAAIEARDPPGAQEAMTQHLAVAYRHYGDDLERPVDEIARREVRRLLGPTATLEGLLGSVLR